MSNLTVSTSTGNGNGGTRREYFVDPKIGMYPAVCVDVIDHGFSRNNYGKVARKIQFAFQLAKTIDEKAIVAAKGAKGLSTDLDDDDRNLIGARLFVRSKKMTLSLYPGGENMKSSDLYAFLESWSGERFPQGKPLTINLEDYIGKNATLMITRNPDKRDPSIVYSNIASINPPEDDAELLELLPDSYTRVKDRDNFTPPPTEEDVNSGAVAATNGNGNGASAPAPAVTDEDADVDIPYEPS